MFCKVVLHYDVNNEVMSEIILSGIQPTGALHLGNYLGAVQNWVEIAKNKQNNDKMFFSVVDLHAITIEQKPAELRENIYKTLATYIACGIDCQRDDTCLFVQSHVSYHAHLAWILSCNTSNGWLDKMTQYKSKTKANKDRECLGLYAYPVLMAADILLYQATLVPVGEDQVQHLELTRDIAEKMNAKFGNIFTVPKYLLNKQTKRIMSLQDGSSKMSKSDANQLSCINLIDSNDEITNKIKRAKTDSISGIFQAEGRLEVNNLLRIFSALCGHSVEELSAKYQSCQTSAFKTDLADCIIQALSPIRGKINELTNNKPFLDAIIAQNAEYANTIALQTITKLNQAMGL